MTSRDPLTLLHATLLLLLLAGSSSAQVIDGPGGGITSVTTTIPSADLLAPGNGGTDDPSALTDGITNSSAGTFVEWRPPHRFVFELADDQDVSEFLLWNDRGQLDSGIGYFTLLFFDANGFKINPAFSAEAALPPVQNDATAAVFTFPPVVGVRWIEFSVMDDVSGGGTTQFREVAFRADDGTLLDGPSGEIVSVTTTAPLIDDDTGGNISPIATIDGVTNGSQNSYVEWDLAASSFTFSFDCAYDLTALRIWNDRGQVDAVLGDIELQLFDAHGGLIAAPFVTTLAIPSSGSSPTPEVVPFGTTIPNVSSVTLTALDVGSFTSVTLQLREVAFEGTPGVTVGTWTNLGFAKLGTNGFPLAVGTGDLTGGSVNQVALSNALPSAATTLVVGLTNLSIPFQGGVLVPSPDILVFVATDGTGAFTLPFVWPAAIPKATQLYWQFFVSDPSAVQGRSSSNGLESSAGSP